MGLAAAVGPAPGVWDDDPDEEENVRALAAVFARAMSGRRIFTGMRPIAGDFNGWYLRRVAHTSYWTYRERHAREVIVA